VAGVVGALGHAGTGGVELDLVDGRHDVAGVEQHVELGGGEVRHADGAHHPVGVQLFQGAPGLDVDGVGGGGPVDEVQVDDVESEPAAAGVERVQGRLAAVVVVPDLGGDEHLRAVESGGGERRGDVGLVAVHLGGVETAVPGLQRRGDGVAPHPPGAEAQPGHGDAVVEGGGGNRHGCSLLGTAGVHADGYPRRRASIG